MGTDERDAADRLADHAAIDALANELIPALIAKLGASGLGEIEVREGDWKVRLRRPADGVAPAGGRRTGRPAASTAPVRPSLTPVGPGRGGSEEAEARVAAGGADIDGLGPAEPGGRGRDPFRAMATSPAVGFYQPRSGIVPGSRVRAGDPIGAIDVLGVPTEVVAPADGIVGASLVETGEAVEYGQELVWIELLSAPPGGSDALAALDPSAAGELVARTELGAGDPAPGEP
jgi:biotin carboxyl carrier protein